MKKIATVIALVAAMLQAFACNLLTKEQAEQIIPLLETQIRFVPVTPEPTDSPGQPGSYSDGPIYLMEDWAEWDTPDDRPVFYLGRGKNLVRVQIPHGIRIVPGAFSPDCTKYYAAVSELNGADFKLSEIDFLTGTITRLNNDYFANVLSPGATGTYATYRVGTQYYKLNTATGVSTPLVNYNGGVIMWADYSNGYLPAGNDVFTVNPTSGSLTLLKTLPFSINTFYARDVYGREYIITSADGNALRMTSNGVDWDIIHSNVAYMLYDPEQHIFFTSVNGMTGGSETWFVKNDGTAEKYFPEKMTSHQIQNFCRESFF